MKKIKIVVLTVLAMCFTLDKTIKAQIISVRLKTDTTFSTSEHAVWVSNDSSVIANIPYKHYPFWSLRKFTYYSLQARYETALNSAGGVTFFKRYATENNYDTTFLSKQSIPGNFIYLVTGLDSNGRKHVTIDANNNHDLSDDKEYIFEDSNQVNLAPIVYATISYYNGQQVMQANVPLQLKAFETAFADDFYKSVSEKNLDVGLNEVFYNRQAIVVINEKKYLFTIKDYNELRPRGAYSVNIQKLPYDARNNNNYYYKNTDTLEFDGNLYTILSFENNQLQLTPAGKSAYKGADVGTLAPNIIAKDLITNGPFSLKRLKGKYVLIDFWGSWCVPCINLIPELRAANDKYKNSIQFVSIAYDRDADKIKLKKLIETNNMNWIHLMDDKDARGGIVDRYKVNAFPTSVLIDPSGKVIYRGVADTGLKRLFAYFDSLKR
ncbi:TlpA family protein disulfide reductase [Mucilaginibacter psychrotolerans]|uniref:TlpA family protein disulfide reductase n=1 Tax=Mucilaginibacter psychrotolerans TaxID=1524096 RepID=A0A4Y8SEK1_9SPHI|nr:TlpA disulfide reductase family protein [Mucilaginibacter psychrotolerans]TFF37322.1 TlpA family protein disulfide reductase [Mucilaginibacter psychrotolerans]